MLKITLWHKFYSCCCIGVLRSPLWKHNAIGRRTFLSEAYRCQDGWNKRLKSPILQNINLDEFYYELDLKYNQDEKINEVDVDLFANAIHDEVHLDQLEDLIHKLRKSDAAHNIFPSTSHALIRLFLQYEKYEDLLRILDDRINYGVFPDYYTSSLMMDTFIKNNAYSNAARVAVLHMLQEDWDDPLSKHLALYSSHMYLREPDDGTWVEPVKETEDDGEEIMVRVVYVREPFFDDHFDLRNPKLLVGKTLASLGATLPNEIGRSYQLIGWSLYNKWSKVHRLLEEFKSSNEKTVLYKYGIEKSKEVLDEALSKENITDKETMSKVSELLQDSSLVSKTIDEDPHEAIVSSVNKAVETHADIIAQEQNRLYDEWEAYREESLRSYLAEEERLRRLEKVEQMKADIEQREKVLFFFDHEEEWEMKAEKTEALLEEKKERTKYIKKIGSMKDAEYVPPDIVKRRPSA